jgi:hypothetical protein
VNRCVLWRGSGRTHGVKTDRPRVRIKQPKKKFYTVPLTKRLAGEVGPPRAPAVVTKTTPIPRLPSPERAVELIWDGVEVLRALRPGKVTR